MPPTNTLVNTQHFILLGPPGVDVLGQATQLAAHWRLPLVSVDALVQGAIAQETALGLELRPHLEAETPVPDALMMRLIRKRFEQPDTMLNGWVLVGFPRTVGQAEAFEVWWAAAGQPAPSVVYLKAMTGVVLNRLWEARQPHESMPMIRRRLEQYEAEIAPILDYYQGRSQLKTLNASLSLAEVTRDLLQLGQPETATTPLLHNEAELDAQLAETPFLVVDCMASWCGSCKQVSPAIDKLATAYGTQIHVMKIDFDANRQISKRFGLKGIPAVMFFKQGELLETLTGVKSYQEYSAAVERLLH